MECSEYRRLISRMIDGECDAPLRESIEAHLRDCEECRAFLESTRELFALHRGLGESAPPGALAASVMGIVEAQEHRSRFAGFMKVVVPIAAAVVLVFGIYAGSALVDLYNQPASNGQLAALDLEYLDEYPPGSVGEAIMTVTEGGNDVK